MQYKIGKIINYDDNSGEIVSLDGEYFFIKEDIIGKIQNNDLVKFRDEFREDKRVFFVERVKQ